MKTIFCALVVTVLSAASTLASGPSITATQLERDRAVVQGEIDPAHVLVLRIDDGSAKPHESVAWADATGKFEYVVQVTDKIRLEGGQTGPGIEASYSAGNTNSTTYLPGKFALRPKAAKNKDGSVTIADLHRDDGRISAMSIRIAVKK